MSPRANFSRLLLLLILAAIAPQGPCASAQSGSLPYLPEVHIPDAHIPEVHATSFSGQPVALPTALHGNLGILVLGFSQESRGEAADWGRRLAARPSAAPGPAVYSMAMLAGVPRLLRSYVTGRIKASVPQTTWPQFLPVTDHEAEWKQAAGFTHPEDAYVVVIDGTGAVRCRLHGAATDAAFNDLERKVAEIVAPAAPHRASTTRESPALP